VNVINIELPPLRSRVSDIPVLAHSFLEQVHEDSRRKVSGFADDAMAMLEAYHWPGNVRELQNVVERAVLLGKGPIISTADLPSELRGSNGFMISAPVGQKTLKEALEGPERQIIREVLESNGWNRNLTADQLGINRTTLYKKMKRLGLEDGRVGVM
jgi:DNA-binding NtrC family response regulator